MQIRIRKANKKINIDAIIISNNYNNNKKNEKKTVILVSKNLKINIMQIGLS